MVGFGPIVVGTADAADAAAVAAVVETAIVAVVDIEVANCKMGAEFGIGAVEFVTEVAPDTDWSRSLENLVELGTVYFDSYAGGKDSAACCRSGL